MLSKGHIKSKQFVPLTSCIYIFTSSGQYFLLCDSNDNGLNKVILLSRFSGLQKNPTVNPESAHVPLKFLLPVSSDINILCQCAFIMIDNGVLHYYQLQPQFTFRVCVLSVQFCGLGQRYTVIYLPCRWNSFTSENISRFNNSSAFL